MAFTTALLDANVLHPMVLCDLLIRLAQRGLYRALWTREILAEVVATVLRRRPDLSVELLRKRTNPATQRRLMAHLRRAGLQAIGH